MVEIFNAIIELSKKVLIMPYKGMSLLWKLLKNKWRQNMTLRCIWRVDCGYGKAVCHKQLCPYMRQAGAMPPKPPENSSKWDAAVEILRNYAKEHGYDEQ